MTPSTVPTEIGTAASVLQIRSATTSDLRDLLRIENSSFDSDRISSRSFRHLITRGKASTLVAIDSSDGHLLGYILTLFHAGTSLGRIYSLATEPAARGRGVGRALMAAAEADAVEHGCASLRLEVREDNHGAHELYRSLGYRQFAIVTDYYEDHEDALRFQKVLSPLLRSDWGPVPYYRQTLDFTCGPASLIMAMQALDPQLEADRALELRIWREATTIFMTSGHGGCGPYGLALSAHRRRFGVEVYVSEQVPLFLDSVRSQEKKEVMRLVQEEMLQELAEEGVVVSDQRLAVDELKQRFEAGAMLLVLISSYRIYQEKFPHWVAISGFDERFIYLHDPYVDEEVGKTETDCVNLPIRHDEFERMARYGKSNQRATLILLPPPNETEE
jgi:ribosomal protein S18 acetylase RimI-like enzyme/predicted double-glycine peptidase